MSGSTRYRVLGPIRVGGAFDLLEAVASGAGDFERRVALKRVRQEEEGLEEANQAILTEARLSGRLRHGNIVTTIDAGVDEEGRAFLVMDYVDGLDAAALWKRGHARGRPMPVEVVAHVVAEVAHALDYVHAATDRDGRALSIVHRDVTPANVMISWSGDVLLTDFGIARGFLREHRTAAGLAKGTVDFMAPEQVTGGHIDLRADIYGLGALLHALLTGRSPTQGLEAPARARGHRVVDARLPPALQRVVLRATAPSRADRYASAGELAQDVWRSAPSAIEGGRAALRAWLGPLRAPSVTGPAPAVAELFALELVAPSGLLDATSLDLDAHTHPGPPQEHSSLGSYVDGEDASTAEAPVESGVTAAHQRPDVAEPEPFADAATALDMPTPSNVEVAPPAPPLDLLAPVRLAGVPPPPIERTRAERSPRAAPSPPARPPEDEVPVTRRVSAPRGGVVVEELGTEFGPLATATAEMADRRRARPAIAGVLIGAAIAALIGWAWYERASRPETSPARPVSSSPTPLAAPIAAPEARPSAVLTASVASARRSPAVVAPTVDVEPAPARTPVAARPSARRATPRSAPSAEPPPPTPSPDDRAAAVARLDAVGRRLKTLAQGGVPEDELGALESEYFRLRNAAPRTPEEERALARSIDALWSRVERASR